MVERGDVLVNRGASFSVGNASVAGSNLKHGDPGKLRDLESSEDRALNNHLARLPGGRLRPAEFLDEKTLELKLLEPFPHSREINSHNLYCSGGRSLP